MRACQMFLCWLLLCASFAVMAKGEEAAVLRGEKVFNDRDKGHCLLCHALAKNPAPFQGNLGPALDHLNSRFDRAELTERIADARVFNPDTIMPPYFSKQDLHQVAAGFQGKTVLTKEQLDDLVTYLLSVTNETSQK